MFDHLHPPRWCFLENSLLKIPRGQPMKPSHPRVFHEWPAIVSKSPPVANAWEGKEILMKEKQPDISSFRQSHMKMFAFLK